MEASHAHDEAEKKKRIMEKRHGTKVHRSGQQTSIDSHLPWKETKNMNQESTLHVRKLRCSERRRGHRRRLGNGGPARAGSANVLGFGWGWCTLVFTGKPAEILSLLYCQDISCNYCWECTDWCSLVLWKNPSICFLPLSLSLFFWLLHHQAQPLAWPQEHATPTAHGDGTKRGGVVCHLAERRKNCRSDRGDMLNLHRLAVL